MTRKMVAATSLFGAIAVASAVGLLMSGGSTGTRRMVKRASTAVNNAGEKMQDVAHTMLKKM